jgi:hypothetical protein
MHETEYHATSEEHDAEGCAQLCIQKDQLSKKKKYLKAKPGD